MDSQLQLCATLQATPHSIVEWLHILIEFYAAKLSEATTLIFGPHTFVADAPTPYETIALYVVDKLNIHDIAARQVAISITYLPLSQPEIGLDLRVWPLFPATLDALKIQFLEYFALASPVLSSAAILTFATNVPRRACNQWLADQLQDPSYTDYKSTKKLYPAWLEQYRAIRGEYPADPRRAFRGLVRTALDQP